MDSKQAPIAKFASEFCPPKIRQQDSDIRIIHNINSVMKMAVVLFHRMKTLTAVFLAWLGLVLFNCDSVGLRFVTCFCPRVTSELHFLRHIILAHCIANPQSGPNYAIDIVGKCIGPTTSKGPSGSALVLINKVNIRRTTRLVLGWVKLCVAISERFRKCNWYLKTFYKCPGSLFSLLYERRLQNILNIR